MQPTDDQATALARRLRRLRQHHWRDRPLTQPQLARALGVSVPLISSWENSTKPTVPPEERLLAYARFFASHRSVERTPFRALPEGDFSPDERAGEEALERELMGLREAALQRGDTSPIGGPWHFRDQQPVTMVCAQLPPDILAGMPNVNPDEPDYTELYNYPDLDALLELHGHIRAVNPASQVTIRSAATLTTDDYTTHLVVLGGVDWNTATQHLLRVLDVPVTQVSDDHDPRRGHFEVMEGDQPRQFRPVLDDGDSRGLLTEDVAHVFRAPNPFNHKRTVTICNGMFSRGVLGAVRTLTDARFRDRNAQYLAQRFRGGTTVSILARVHIVNGTVVTPDWTVSDTRLHEWPEATQ